MTDACLNAKECCDPQIWIPPPPGIAGQLEDSQWLMPCDDFGACVDATPVVTVLRGTPGEVYTITGRVRGIVERKTHTGGVVQSGSGGLCVLGGTPNNTSYNNYTLETSNPAAIYHLNVGAEASRLIVDYQFTFDAVAGSTITLRAVTYDAFEHLDPYPLSIVPGPNDPPITITQPFKGQFLTLHVVSVL